MEGENVARIDVMYDGGKEEGGNFYRMSTTLTSVTNLEI